MTEVVAPSRLVRKPGRRQAIAFCCFYYITFLKVNARGVNIYATARRAKRRPDSITSTSNCSRFVNGFLLCEKYFINLVMSNTRRLQMFKYVGGLDAAEFWRQSVPDQQ